LEQRLVVARPVMKRASLPDGFEISPYKFIGKRVPVRNKRNAGYRLYYAEWPEDHLQELTAPKLICVTKGITNYVAGKYVVTCSEGHFILLPAFVPNLAGRYRPHSENEYRKSDYCELLQILVGRDDIRCMYSIQTKEDVQDIAGLSCSIFHPQAMRLFNDFAEQTQTDEHQNPQLQQHLLAAFFWMLLNEINAGHEFYAVLNNHPQTSQPRQTADELRGYIKANLRHMLTIEKVAQHLYTSPRQFTRYLRKEFDQGFVELLNECRLEESKRFLRETGWTIDGIAWMVGFKSAAYFNTFFRRHMGCTPGDYRKKNAFSKIDQN
jgi:AraC-like DNA-binding protein